MVNLKSSKIPLLLFSAVLIIIHFFIYERFLPIDSGLMGHDFNNYFPYFLDGFYWFKNNGFFSVQWFTPSFCGGIPKFPNPVSIYFSIPQFLFILTDPLSSIRLTFLIFSIIGYTGFYLLLNKIFRLNLIASLTGASLFLYNDFFAHKFIVGHLTYHTFMLMPVVAYFIFANNHINNKFLDRNTLADVSISGLILAYMFYVDIAYISAPTLVFILICGSILAFKNNNISILIKPVFKLTISGIVACGIFAAKLIAATSFLKFHDRDFYPLPGVDNFPDLLIFTFKTLFISPQHLLAENIFVNKQFTLGQHEFEFGITIIPLILILIGIISLIPNFMNSDFRKNIDIKRLLIFFSICLFISLPVLFNYYSPEWNHFLKKIPLFKSSSSLVRWFCLYIPVFILIACLFFDQFKLSKNNQLISFIIIVFCLLLTKSFKNRDYYYEQNYNPAEIIEAYKKVENGTLIPAISGIGVYLDNNQKPVISVTRNNALAHGYSQLFCYEAIFGYGLESLPFGTLHPGSIMNEINGTLNIKNPACYVFPEENNCTSGDHFLSSQKEQALEFSKYKPFDFMISDKQKAANLISLTTLLLVICLITENLLFRIRKYLKHI